MLEIKRTAVTLDPEELLELEKIITDQNEGEALQFLKKAIYSKIARLQRGCLKSHLDTGANPVTKFKKEQ